MPYKRKNSAVWWASFTDPSGQRVRRSTGTQDRQEAEALEAKWKVEAFRQQAWNEQPKRTFEELMVTYLKVTEKDKKSADKDKTRARNLRQFFGGRILNDLKSADIRAYQEFRRKQGRSNATINRDLALLSSAINYANREWDWNIPNMASDRKLKEPEGRTRTLTEVEYGQLIEAAKLEPRARHLPDFITLAVHTGCRAGELLGLPWSEVNLANNVFVLEGRRTKSGKRRGVPLNHTARQVMLRRAAFRAQHCPHSPWVFCDRTGRQIVSVRKSFDTARKRAGLEDFRIHDLRHTCATWLVNQGVSLTDLRDLLGHSTVKVTERYAHLDQEKIKDAVKLLDRFQSRSHSGHSGQKPEVKVVPLKVIK